MERSNIAKVVLKESKWNNNKNMVIKKDDGDGSKNGGKKTNVSKKTSSTNKDSSSKKTKPVRPKPIYFWTNVEVMKWLHRQCTEYHTLYGQLFVENDITGRTLVRMTEITLQKLGITNDKHREEIWQEILKLRLKTDILEMRDLEMKGL